MSERMRLSTAECARSFQLEKESALKRLTDARLEIARQRRAREWARARLRLPRGTRRYDMGRNAVFVDAHTPEVARELKLELAKHFGRLNETFRAWDVDHDHAIDVNELRLALAALRIPHDPEDVESLFHSIDRDRSGKVDSEELYEALKGHGAPRRPHPSERQTLSSIPKRREPNPQGGTQERRAVMDLKRTLHTHIGRVRELFGQWDLDGDGLISPSELRRALAGLCIPIDEPALARLFRIIDSDNSGSIDLTELEGVIRMDMGDDGIVESAAHGPDASAGRSLRPSSSPARVGRAGLGGLGSRSAPALHHIHRTPPSTAGPAPLRGGAGRGVISTGTGAGTTGRMGSGGSRPSSSLAKRTMPPRPATASAQLLRPVRRL
jgi:Ca2+-binding EF-hand superfamily protein